MASGKTWELLTGAAITEAGTSVLQVHPDIDDVAGAVARAQLPGTIMVSAAYGDATSITRTISAQLVG